MIIASSYSGNTEETISVFEGAQKQNIARSVIAKGGILLETAKEEGLPYIQIPDTGVQPRSALGFSFKALAKMVGRDDLVEQASKVGAQLQSENFEEQGRRIAEKLRGKIPLVYASQKNYSVAYNWKIKFNETAKIPAFYNL